MSVLAGLIVIGLVVWLVLGGLFALPAMAGGFAGLLIVLFAIALVVGILSVALWLVGLVLRIVFGVIGLALGLVGALLAVLLLLPLLALPFVVLGGLVWLVWRALARKADATPPALPGATVA